MDSDCLAFSHSIELQNKFKQVTLFDIRLSIATQKHGFRYTVQQVCIELKQRVTSFTLIHFTMTIQIE